MNKSEIEKIKEYCQKATPGPWKRSHEQSKVITFDTDKPPHKWKNVISFVSGSHVQDWMNFHFITKARTDLPRLASYCLELMRMVDMTNYQLELEKANRRLEKNIARLHVRQTMKSKFRLKKQNQDLETQCEQTEREKESHKLKVMLTERQVQLEKSISRLQQQRLHKQLELERIQKLELFDRDTGFIKGQCDKMLDDLDKVEARFKGPVAMEKHLNGWTANDPAAKARQIIYSRSQDEESESAHQQPPAEQSEPEYRSEEHFIETVQQAYSHNETPTETMEVSAVQNHVESCEDTEMTLENETQEELQKRLGLQHAQEAVEEYITYGGVNLDEILDELDKTEAVLNSWSSEGTEGYGKFGENLSEASKMVTEFMKSHDAVEVAEEAAVEQEATVE